MIENYKQIVSLVADFSTCCKKRVGAIIIDNLGEIVASGYNKSIGESCASHYKNIWQDTEGEKPLMYNLEGQRISPLEFKEWCKTSEAFKEEHRIWSKQNEIHAEIHALSCFNPQHKNYSMIITLEPCIECAKAIIINDSIRKVFYIKEFKKNSGIELLKKNLITVQKI